MKKIDATQARQEFSETVNRVAYGGDRIVVSRRGKDLAAMVPVDDLDLIERCEEDEAARKKATKSRGRAKTRKTGAGKRPTKSRAGRTRAA